MSLSFLSPWWSLLVLLVPLFWIKRPASGKRWLSVTRSVITLLFVLAMMQPVLVNQYANSTRVLIVDIKNDVPEKERMRAISSITHWRENGNAENSHLIIISEGGSNLKDFSDDAFKSQLNAVSVSQALSQAELLIPTASAGEITLISDGRATDQHWESSIARLLLRQIPVSILSLDVPTSHPVIVDTKVAPWFKGQQFKVDVFIAEGRDGLTLVARSDDKDIVRIEDIPVNQQVVTLTGQLPDKDVNKVEISLLDGNTPVSRRSLIIGRQAPVKLLYISEQPTLHKSLSDLLGDGFSITAIHSGQLAEIKELTAFSLAILDDVVVENLPENEQLRLLEAVDEYGMGILFSGGERAFAKRDLTQPLLRSLPLTADPQQKMKDPSVALAVIIDSSGSMEGEPVSLAKKIARLAVRKLKPDDQIGIVEFYGNKQWAVPIQPVRNTENIERAIGRIQASGATVLFPAIEEAYYGLKQAKAKFKHMLVISDAGVEDENYQQLLRAIAKDNINVSTLLVGGGGMGEEKMQELADWGRGRFYLIEDEFSLVELDFHQQQPQPQDNFNSGQFRVYGSGNTAIPAVLGYSKTSVQQGADVVLTLTASAGESTIPLYASWPVGRGEIAALSNPLLGKGLATWQKWDGYGDWLASVILKTAHVSERYSSLIFRQGDEVTLWLKSNLPDTRSNQLNAIPVVPVANATSYTGELIAKKETLDWYRAKFSYPHNADLIVDVGLDDEKWRVTDSAGSDVRDVSQMTSSQRMPLAFIADLSGGRYSQADAPVESYSRTTPASKNWQAIELSRWPLLVALSLYLFEVFWRRRPFSARTAGKRGVI